MIQLIIHKKLLGGKDPVAVSDDTLIAIALEHEWSLGAKAHKERLVLISDGQTGRAVIQLTGIFLKTNGKSNIVGQRLAKGHPVFDSYVGAATIHRSKNPVFYIENEEYQCLCGCGATINRGSFAIGHDQKAIHERIRKHFGSVEGFLEWCDQQQKS